MLVRIVPVGNIPQKLLETVAAEIHERVGIKAKLMPAQAMPHESFDHWRKQYNAEKIIEIFSKSASARFIDKSILTLFIVDNDIYYNGLNWIFGLEDIEYNACIISLTRLRNEFYNHKPNLFLLIERAVKEAIHEMGHYLGLEHCHHPFCVMVFSKSIADVDRKQKDFCRDCKIKLAIRGHNID